MEQPSKSGLLVSQAIMTIRSLLTFLFSFGNERRDTQLHKHPRRARHHTNDLYMYGLLCFVDWYSALPLILL